jgi:predicted nucleic acid-binding protein
MTRKAIVLDANILIRAVLGQQVRRLIFKHAETTQFFAPDVAYADARKYLPVILQKRNVTETALLPVLERLETVVHMLDSELYAQQQEQACRRIAERDMDDWPILASALALSCPIWSEDQDFFGTGVAVWTSRLVHLYLEQ